MFSAVHDAFSLQSTGPIHIHFALLLLLFDLTSLGFPFSFSFFPLSRWCVRSLRLSLLSKIGHCLRVFFFFLYLRVTRYCGTESPSSSHTKRQKYWMKFSSKWHSSGRWAEVHILIKMICAAWIYRFVVEIVVCINARYICSLLRYRLQSAYTPTTYDYLPNIERESELSALVLVIPLHILINTKIFNGSVCVLCNVRVAFDIAEWEFREKDEQGRRANRVIGGRNGGRDGVHWWRRRSWRCTRFQPRYLPFSTCIYFI